MSTNNTRQAAWVAIGSFFSFAVGIISPMILSRFFSVGDYGTYKQVMYVYSTLLSVFTLGLPKAYAFFLPKHPNEESKAIINKITILFLILGGVFSLFLFLGAGFIATLLGNPDLAFALRVFSPVPLFLLPTMGLDGIFASYQKTQFLAVYTIITKIILIVFSVLPVVIFHGNYLYAILGFDVASILTCITALFFRSLPIRHYPLHPTSVTYKQILNFAVPLLFASVWGMLYVSVNQFYISRYYGKEAFAVFSNGFIEMPFLGMVIGAISTVLLPVFSRLEKGDGLSDSMFSIWNSAIIKSAKVIFPMSVFCIFMAKLVMVCFYGNVYEQSSAYFQIKNVYGLFYIVPFAPVLIAMGKTKVYSNVTMLFSIIITILGYLSVKFLDSPLYLAIISEVSSIAKCTVFFVLIARYSSMQLTAMMPFKSLFTILFASILSSIPVLIISNNLVWNKFVLLFFSIGVFCAIYYVICWVIRITYRDILASIVGKNMFLNKALKLIP